MLLCIVNPTFYSMVSHFSAVLEKAVSFRYLGVMSARTPVAKLKELQNHLWRNENLSSCFLMLDMELALDLHSDKHS